MSVQVEEMFGFPKVTSSDKPTARSQYRIIGTDNASVAASALVAEAPPALGDDLFAKDYRVEPMGVDWWYGFVDYDSFEPRSTAFSKYSFSTTGETAKITQSLATVGRYGIGGQTPPDLKGVIGWDGKTVKGCSIPIPCYKWSEQRFFSSVAINSDFRKTLSSLTGTVNDGAFRDFLAGEVLFIGAAGSFDEGKRLWDISYEFAAQPNMSSLTVGGIEDIVKDGWDYLWTRNKVLDGNTNHILSIRPIAIYVERVHYRKNFALLGIGTDPMD